MTYVNDGFLLYVEYNYVNI